MMKFKMHKILIAALVLVLMFSIPVFADTKIISPNEFNIESGDSFFVSIKVTDAKNTRVTVYQEEIYHIGLVEKEITIKSDEIKDEGSDETKTIKYMVSEKIYEKYTDVDKLEIDDLKLLSSGDILDENGNEIILSNGQSLKYISEKEKQSPEEYKAVNGVGLYYKEFNDVGQGIYKVVCEELDDNGDVINESSCFVLLKSEQDESEQKTPTKDTEKEQESEDEKPQGFLAKVMAFLKKLFK